MSTAGYDLWFVIKSGPDAGRLHLRGWTYSAIYKGDPRAHRDENPYFGYAHCPRCFAMVPNDTGDEEMNSPQVWGHEQWHAATDYPIPPSVADEALAFRTERPVANDV